MIVFETVSTPSKMKTVMYLTKIDTVSNLCQIRAASTASKFGTLFSLCKNEIVFFLGRTGTESSSIKI